MNSMMSKATRKQHQGEHALTAHIPRESALISAYNACAALLRVQDFDRYCACLFAPAAARGALMALYAFNAEIARIRDAVHEPLPGEIRCQWWRDNLTSQHEETDIAHPVLFATKHIIAQFHLPVEPFIALIEARGFDLYDDPMPTMMDLEVYCAETSAALIRLACLILAGGEEAGSAALCGHAGLAYAYTGLLRAFPLHARRQQCYLAHEVLIACGAQLDDIYEGRESDNLKAALALLRSKAWEHLSHVRAGIRAVDRRIAPAFYPLSLVDPYLKRMEQADYAPFSTPIDLPPLLKFWYIGRGAWRASSHKIHNTT